MILAVFPGSGTQVKKVQAHGIHVNTRIAELHELMLAELPERFPFKFNGMGSVWYGSAVSLSWTNATVLEATFEGLYMDHSWKEQNLTNANVVLYASGATARML